MVATEEPRVAIAWDALDLTSQISNQVRRLLLTDAVERVRQKATPDALSLVTDREIREFLTEEWWSELIPRLRELPDVRSPTAGVNTPHAA